MNKGIIAINIFNEKRNVLSTLNPMMIYWNGQGEVSEVIKENLYDYIIENHFNIDKYFGFSIYWKSVFFEGFNKDDKESTMSGIIPVEGIVNIDNIIDKMCDDILTRLTDNLNSVTNDTYVNFARSLCHQFNISLTYTRMIIDNISKRKNINL